MEVQRLFLDESSSYTILQVDENWVKVIYKSKNKKDRIKILRIDSIELVEVIE